MKKQILTFALLTALVFTSCKEAPAKDDAVISTETTNEDVVNSTFTNKEGKQLEMKFDNINGTATINFDGETSELKAERSGSGIWYKNDDYELRGKGNDIELSKNGKLIFEHKDEMGSQSLKDNNGQTLDLKFNNTENTVKAYLNGGEQIDLVGEKAASGIWYKNDQYELRGKGNQLTLTKDGKTVFEN